MTYLTMLDMRNTFVRWLIKGFLIPVFLPWFIYQIYMAWQYLARHREKLENKVVLITGASSGLGEALATEFYKAGAKVILASRRVQELERVRGNLICITTRESTATYPKIMQLDLSDLTSIPSKIQEAMKIFGKIDILVNNGGISYRGDVLSTSMDVDVKVMVVNYFGQVAVTKAVLASMIGNRSGHIVGISSIQGKIAIPYRSAYAASKHALQAYFDSLRAENEYANIKVTVVSPGYMKTNLSMNAITEDGSTYGVMDSTTASGMDPSTAAKKILRAIVLEQQEVILSTFFPQAAIILRNICPPMYFSLMRYRAEQQQKILYKKRYQGLTPNEIRYFESLSK